MLSSGKLHPFQFTHSLFHSPCGFNRNNCLIFSCSNTNNESTTSVAPLMKKRKRYRKLYPGESQGIVEEMRFVAMKLRSEKVSNAQIESSLENSETWEPKIEGFINYLVDSKLVFETLECIVEESEDVSYAYFRKTGLERAEVISKDLEWFSQQGWVIPEPSNPGASYAGYLAELAGKSAPMFLCHFYNIYFAHISGGQVIAKQVSKKLLEGRELEFCRWEGDALELLKDVRDKLNNVGENPELGNVVYVLPGFVSVVGCRIIPQELGPLGIEDGPILWAPVFEIIGDTDGSMVFFLHGRERDCDHLYPGSLKAIDKNCNVLLLEVEPKQINCGGTLLHSKSLVHCNSDRELSKRICKSDRGSSGSQRVLEKNSIVPFCNLGFGDRRKLLELVADHVRLRAPNLANGLLFPPLRDDDESFRNDIMLMSKRRSLLMKIYKFGEGCTNLLEAH
ncbi:hypothetical protein IFM89_001821 [Coptis chinensis]|uniref:Inactive heme oxygenase 2, chloroplastic n=1 Tax=Coptis chinensis TaxID=261450 RepID=A0A835LM00_9MAGN|nr:hypothetical protein IFM89_001821 [Coptis chinensis]